jgi:ATP-dependent DNA ligase
MPPHGLEPPSGAGWVHEIKHDGYRLLVRRDGDRVRLFTRRGYDWTKKYPWIVEAARKLKIRSFLIDGEAVFYGPDGISDFDRLHSQAYNSRVFLYGFDLLQLDGDDWREYPLERRKAKLQRLLIESHGMTAQTSLSTYASCREGPHIGAGWRRCVPQGYRCNGTISCCVRGGGGNRRNGRGAVLVLLVGSA